jgi:hypothetical protein
MPDYEEQYRLLAPSPEYLASVQVFPLIPRIKNDVTVRFLTMVKKLRSEVRPRKP